MDAELEAKQFSKAGATATPPVIETTPCHLAKQKSTSTTPASLKTATTASGDSPQAKSFSSSEDSLERDNSITLRKFNAQVHQNGAVSPAKHRSEERQQRDEPVSSSQI